MIPAAEMGQLGCGEVDLYVNSPGAHNKLEVELALPIRERLSMSSRNLDEVLLTLWFVIPC